MILTMNVIFLLSHQQPWRIFYFILLSWLPCMRDCHANVFMYLHSRLNRNVCQWRELTTLSCTMNAHRMSKDRSVEHSRVMFKKTIVLIFQVKTLHEGHCTFHFSLKYSTRARTVRGVLFCNMGLWFQWVRIWRVVVHWLSALSVNNRRREF